MPASSTRAKRPPAREHRYVRDEYKDEARPAKRKKRKDPLWARLTVILGALLMMVGGGGIVAARLAIASATSKITTTTMIDSKSGALAGANIDGAINLLMVGIDVEERADRGGGVLSDSIVIMHIPKTHDQAYLLSIPRDTKVSIEKNPKSNFGGTSLAKINSAFGAGYQGPGTELEKRARGVDLLARTINKLTGIKFNGAMLIDFDGFRSIVEELGGVDLCVDQRAESIHLAHDATGKIVDVWYDDAASQVRGIPKGGKVVVHEPGCRAFTAQLALDFSRIRKGLENGDYDRQRHQQQLIKAIAKKATSKGVLTDPGKLNRVIAAGGKAMILDPGGVPLEDFIFTMKDVAANDLVMIRTNPGTWSIENVNGQSFVVLNEASLQLFHAARDGNLSEFLVTHPEFLAGS
ncbi:MAG TPA: LytR family transcriptional regulator [Micromonosporaceae bacterium]|nr:LytR family transcriptional regulator [Micromonosporaceae bacterium]